MSDRGERADRVMDVGSEPGQARQQVGPYTLAFSLAAERSCLDDHLCTGGQALEAPETSVCTKYSIYIQGLCFYRDRLVSHQVVYLIPCSYCLHIQNILQKDTELQNLIERVEAEAGDD